MKAYKKYRSAKVRHNSTACRENHSRKGTDPKQNYGVLTVANTRSVSPIHSIPSRAANALEEGHE